MKQVGLIGPPQSGKTTVLEILLQGAGAGTLQGGRDHVGVVRVPDDRLQAVSALVRPKKTTPVHIQFVDSAGPRAGHGGYEAVRNCDALVAVLRDFEDPAVPTTGGGPERDLAAVEGDLQVHDFGVVESRRERLAREIRVGKREGEAEHELLGRCLAALEAGRALRGEDLSVEDQARLRGFQLLSLKPLLVLHNRGEGEGSPLPPPAAGRQAVALRAQLEREIIALPETERDAFRAALGVAEDGLTRVIRACHRLLGLVSFFTVSGEEVRAWTLRHGESALDAAAEIHTDMARGFIRAEVVECERLIEAGGLAGARERGWMRLEGRDYEVQDGDCLQIRFGR